MDNGIMYRQDAVSKGNAIAAISLEMQVISDKEAGRIMGLGLCIYQ
jgi:hypothetical protein